MLYSLLSAFFEAICGDLFMPFPPTNNTPRLHTSGRFLETALCSKSKIVAQNRHSCIVISIVYRTNIAVLIKHGIVTSPAKSKTHEVITFLESNSFKFPQKRVDREEIARKASPTRGETVKFYTEVVSKS